jgi:Mannose-6-phosphate isomerase
MILQIKHGDKVLAVILPRDASAEGIRFFTPGDYSQQLGYMHHKPGKLIEPHVHNVVHRSITMTQEVLFIRRGKVRVDFYSDDKEYLESYVLKEGDVILLAAGGHGFEVLEELEMIEVKQGPYVGEQDKTRFVGSPSPEIRYFSDQSGQQEQ